MLRWRRWNEDDGTATLEFITAGLILLLPLVYLVLSMAAIQGGALAVEGAARQAVRVFVQAPDFRSAGRRRNRPCGSRSPITGWRPTTSRYPSPARRIPTNA